MNNSNSFFLDAGLHKVHYQTFGDSKNEPIFVIHGGPGGSFNVKKLQDLIPLNKYFMVLIDQRGTNKSLPFAELRENDTFYLVEDIELIRQKLNLDKIMLFGGSWGTTLALVYSIKYPQNVSKMLLRGVFLGRQEDIDFLYQKGASDFYPQEYERFSSFVKDIPGWNNISKYFNLFTGDYSLNLKKQGYQEFSHWEDALVSIEKRDQDFLPDPIFDKQISIMEVFYFMNNCFFPEDNYILNNVHLFAHVPITIIHGRQDIDTRPIGAWLLAKSHPNTQLIFVDKAGHSMWEKNIVKELKNYFQK
ncbi:MULTISPECIES: alpha/beta hydrolase [unclassified Mycoplasma]|uniref:alpha/beta hydrolase n=1 Tax=unclassified Mycoplasma TaxID=2683645 RepID=UPI00211C3FC3|nr:MULTISPECIES: alpha/beta hydrolase [unclassified Mycoplasma]UUM19848.1 alpha/beta hydrolase [Mycoplasma sp. 1578d]UUM24832.1 alpha/beta hydrolase [Mycoplasma sp. 3686d]